MAIAFSLIRPADGKQTFSRYGFSWPALFLGPVEFLVRGGRGPATILLISGYAISACLFLFYDNDLTVLLIRLVAVNLSVALVYNEMQTLWRMSHGFELLGPRYLLEYLGAKYASDLRKKRKRLLFERCFILILFSIGVTQAYHRMESVGRGAQLKTVTASRVKSPETPALSNAAEAPPILQAPAGADPKQATVDSLVVSQKAPNDRMVAPDHTSATVEPALTLEESQRQCDLSMGTQFDTDLPKSVAPTLGTSRLSEDALQAAIANCDRARTAGGRRYFNQLGRALAAQAMLFAANGKEDNAREAMNKALQNWSRAAADGSGSAMNFLGAYHNGTFNNFSNTGIEFTPINYQKALDHWIEGQKVGNARATKNAAVLLLYGSELYAPVVQDINRAMAFFSKAMAEGDISASSTLGESLYYADAKGLKKDVNQAINLLSIACQAGDSKAKAFFDKARKPPVVRPPNC